MTKRPKVTIHMVSSLDCYIAKQDESVSWMEATSQYAHGEEDEDPEEFLKTIDCFVIGSRTYELALKLGWPYGDVPTFVVSSRNLPLEKQSVELYSGDLRKLVNEKLKPVYHNIWLVGGAVLANQFVKLELADDIRLTVIPVLLGDGIKFLENLGKDIKLNLNNVTAYKNGLVDLCYEIRRP